MKLMYVSFDETFLSKILKVPGLLSLISKMQQRKNRREPNSPFRVLNNFEQKGDTQSITLHNPLFTVDIFPFQNKILQLIFNKQGTMIPQVSTDHLQRVDVTSSVKREKYRLKGNDWSQDLIVSETPLLSLQKKNEEIISLNLSTSNNQWVQLTFQSELKHVYGMGEKSDLLNKTESSYEMWNLDNSKFDLQSDPLYKSIPFAILSSPDNANSVGVFVDYPSYQRWIHSGKLMQLEIESTQFQLFILTGSIKEIIRSFVLLTGKPPLPPLWSLGYHQCRWSYGSQDKIMEIANKFREKEIPCDALYLDIDYMSDYKCFTWNKERFPDPAKMVRDLDTKGINLVSIIDPGIKIEDGYEIFQSGLASNLFTKRKGKLFKNKVWPGICVFPDFFQEDALKWWAGNYDELIHIGIAGFWNDMNEPSLFSLQGTMADDATHIFKGQKLNHGKLHNLYGQKMVEGTYMAFKNRDRRAFILSRSGYAGIQRFSWVWTGDNTSSWDHLRLSIPKCLNLGLSGTLSGADIGGFRGSPSPELYARWIQLGVFYPLMRTHTTAGTPDQEPWSFGDEVEKIAREAINLRYTILPYIYTQIWRYTQDGIPPMRPMFLDFDDHECMQEEWENSQFMFGPNLLIAPILYEGARSRRVFLPRGDWYKFSLTGQNEKIDGGVVLEVEASLDEIAIFVRDNSIIPVCEKIGKNVYDSMSSGIKLLKFGDTPSGDLYVDDGISIDYGSGTYGYYSIDKNSTYSLVDGMDYLHYD